MAVAIWCTILIGIGRRRQHGTQHLPLKVQGIEYKVPLAEKACVCGMWEGGGGDIVLPLVSICP